MSTALQLKKRLQALNTNVIIDEAIEENLEEFVSINREQMTAGFTRNADRITRQTVPGFPTQSDGKSTYSPRYAKKKGKSSPIDLHLSGDFQQGMYSSIEGDAIVTQSTDSKQDFLPKQYGSVIFGLGGRYKQEWLKLYLQPAVNLKIRAATGL